MENLLRKMRLVISEYEQNQANEEDLYEILLEIDNFFSDKV